MSQKVIAVLENHEGVRFKTIALPYFHEEVQCARLKRLSLQPVESDEIPMPVERRTFKFWDREGRLYIYREVF